jgi:hypothetical protein
MVTNSRKDRRAASRERPSRGEIVRALARIRAGSGLVEPAVVSSVHAWHGAGVPA